MDLAICRFRGCDAIAEATVGIMPLCVLHQSYVLQLMDQGGECASDLGSAARSGMWPVISTTDVEV